MEIAGNALRMRVYIGESDRWHHQSLAEALLLTAKREGLAGGTVFHGVAGYGAHSRVHTTSILRLSEDLPVVVEFVDRADHIERIRPRIAEMIGEGLVTIDPVEVFIYRSRHA